LEREEIGRRGLGVDGDRAMACWRTDEALDEVEEA
jgi:hypothetical protein